MTFREIKINELLDFIKSDFYKNSAVIPISPQRAISQANNPNSKPDTVALILALDTAENIIGYIGILPGKITLENTPYCWNSCWWVHPEKGKMAAMPLFYKMLKISNHKMVFFELTKTTKAIIKKFDFKSETVEGFKGFLKFNFAQILPRKNAIFKTVKPLLLFIDWILNGLNQFKLATWKKQLSVELKDINDIDEVAEKFIHQFHTQQLIPINKTEINWIVQYPWLKTNPTSEDQNLAKKYFFSSLAKSFANQLVKVYQDHKLIGFLFLTIRDGEMKIPYAFFDEKNIEMITKAIYKVAINERVISFTTFNSMLIEKMKHHKSPFIMHKKLTKYIAYPTSLELNGKTIQDGDGDAVFC